MPGIAEKTLKRVRSLKGRYSERCYVGVAGPRRPLGKKRRLCLPESMKGESCLQYLNSHLHSLHRNLREQRKNKFRGQFISRQMFKHECVCRRGISSLIVAFCNSLTVSASSSKHNKCELVCLCVTVCLYMGICLLMCRPQIVWVGLYPALCQSRNMKK